MKHKIVFLAECLSCSHSINLQWMVTRGLSSSKKKGKCWQTCLFEWTIPFKCLFLEWGRIVHAVCSVFGSEWSHHSHAACLRGSAGQSILWQAKVWIPLTILLPPFYWQTPFPLPLILWSSLYHSAQLAGKKNRNLNLFSVSVVSSQV